MARGDYLKYLFTYGADYCSGINEGVPGVEEGRMFVAKMASILEEGFGDLSTQRKQLLIPYAALIPQDDLTNYTKGVAKLYVDRCE